MLSLVILVSHKQSPNTSVRETRREEQSTAAKDEKFRRGTNRVPWRAQGVNL